MTRLQTLAAGTILAGAALAGGSASAATICFAFQDLETEFWVAGHGAITKTLQDAGHTVIERNGNEDANRQLEQVNDCIAQGVDGIILIPQDGECATTIVAEAQDADVPIAIFNRPPSDLSKGIIVVADNEAIAGQAVDSMSRRRSPAKPDGQAQRHHPRRRPRRPERRRPQGRLLRLDQQAPGPLQRRSRSPPSGTPPPRSPTSRPRSPPTRRSTSSSPRPTSSSRPSARSSSRAASGRRPARTATSAGRARRRRHRLQADQGGYVDATGVQDVYFEAEQSLNAILAAIDAGEAQPNG